MIKETEQIWYMGFIFEFTFLLKCLRPRENCHMNVNTATKARLMEKSLLTKKSALSRLRFKFSETSIFNRLNEDNF